MAIRGIDYTPPIHITFGDFLSAILTADTEVRADDDRYNIRRHLKNEMAGYGIEPSSESEDGRWPRIRRRRRWSERAPTSEALQTDPTEMFRHIWNNRASDRLNLDTDAFNRVASVRPCVRVSPEDGFQLRETVVEWVQYLRVTADELPRYGLKAPRSMPADEEVLVGGGIDVDPRRVRRIEVQHPQRAAGPRLVEEGPSQVWQDRISYLWEGGYLTGPNRSSSLASFHLQRVLEPALASDANAAAVRARPTNDEPRRGGHDDGRERSAAGVQRRLRRLPAAQPDL